MPDPSQFNTDCTRPGRWTITFSNPPINLFVPTTIVELGALMTDLEADQSDADLWIAEYGVLPAGKTHVAGKHELVAYATRAATNLGDAHDRRGRKAQHEVAPKAQHLWSFSRLGYVEMGNIKVGIRRLEYYDLHRRVRLEVAH